jgi:hypothetical protein
VTEIRCRWGLLDSAGSVTEVFWTRSEALTAAGPGHRVAPVTGAHYDTVATDPLVVATAYATAA